MNNYMFGLVHPSAIDHFNNIVFGEEYKTGNVLCHKINKKSKSIIPNPLKRMMQQ
jgi:hypothetical protein